MELAYLVIAHKAPDQVANLVRLVCRPGDYVLIHCDLHAGSAFQEQIATRLTGAGLANVRFAPRRWVNWGGFSVTAVEWEAIQELLAWSKNWRYFINLSGQCMPTKSPIQLAQFLAATDGANYIDCADLQTEWPGALYRLRTMTVEHRSGWINTKIPRHLPRQVRFFGGSAWFIVSRAFCEYLQSSEVFRDTLHFLRHAQIPDELLFQTTIMNSPFRDTVVRDAKRLITWPPGGAPHPNVLTMKDWPHLLEPDHYFARKFDPDVDAPVIDRLAAHVRSSH